MRGKLSHNSYKPLVRNGFTSRANDIDIKRLPSPWVWRTRKLEHGSEPDRENTDNKLNWSTDYNKIKFYLGLTDVVVRKRRPGEEGRDTRVKSVRGPSIFPWGLWSQQLILVQSFSPKVHVDWPWSGGRFGTFQCGSVGFSWEKDRQRCGVEKDSVHCGSSEMWLRRTNRVPKYLLPDLRQ